MSFERVPDTHCNMCRKQMTIMKRCTRCRKVVYCTRDCQIKDWPEHQQTCQKSKIRDSARTSSTQSLGQTDRSKYQVNDHSIFHDETNSAQEGPASHPPLVDWSKAFTGKETVSEDRKSPVCEKTYLYRNEFHTDIPELDETRDFCKVTVKCNKTKYALKIQKDWTGKEVFKFLSYSVKVPLEKLKIIHKGKVLSDETVSETVKDKAVYQVIGETAEAEDGLDQRDITVMMKQLGVDRNQAVKALKKSGDLIDAMLG